MLGVTRVTCLGVQRELDTALNILFGPILHHMTDTEVVVQLFGHFKNVASSLPVGLVTLDKVKVNYLMRLTHLTMYP